MRLIGALLLLLALAGCGEDAQQRLAREEAQRYVAAREGAGDYDVDDTHCTDSARTAVFRIEQTSIFICAVRRSDGGCDWFRVEAAAGGPAIRLEERDAGCVLPE